MEVLLHPGSGGGGAYGSTDREPDRGPAREHDARVLRLQGSS